MPTGPTPFYLGDVVRLRKPHPCGSHEWTVVRLGADIGLRCHGCQHKVLLTRRDLGRRLKTFVSRGPGWAEPGGIETGSSTGSEGGPLSGPSVHVIPLAIDGIAGGRVPGDEVAGDRDRPAPG